MAGKEYKVGVRIHAAGADQAAAEVVGSFRRMRVGARAFGEEFKGFGGKIAGVGAATAALATATAYGIGRFTTEYADRAGDIANLSRQLGLSAEAFQELRYAAEISDVPIEAFDKSVGILNRNLGLMKAGGGPMLKFLSKVEPELLKSVKGAKGTEEALGLIIGAMDQIPDSGRKAALATAVFGKQGAIMARLNAAEVRKLREEKRKDGVITQAEAEYADDFGDNLARLRNTITGVGNEIGGALLPVLQPMILQFRDWVRLNKGEIAKGAVAGIRSLAEGFMALTTKGLPKALALLRTMRDDFVVIKSAAETFAALWLGNKIGKAIQAAAEATRALSAATIAANGVPGAGRIPTSGAGGGMMNAIGSFAGPIAAGIAANMFLYSDWVSGNVRNNNASWNAKNMQAGFSLDQWKASVPASIVSEAERNVRASFGPKYGSFTDQEYNRMSPFLGVPQKTLEEIQRLAKERFGATSLEDMADYRRQWANPFVNGGVSAQSGIASKIEIGVKIEGASKGTRASMKTTGPVRPKLQVYRRLDDEGDGE